MNNIDRYSLSARIPVLKLFSLGIRFKTHRPPRCLVKWHSLLLINTQLAIKTIKRKIAKTEGGGIKAIVKDRMNEGKRNREIQGRTQLNQCN